MFYYRVKIFLKYIIAVLIAIIALVVLYGLFLIIGQFNNPSIALGISAIMVTAPMFAIMEALVAWLRLWRENQIKDELIKVIEAQSTSPKGMDIDALQRESKLPREILKDSVNELILLGRIGVRLTANNNREYFLISAT